MELVGIFVYDRNHSTCETISPSPPSEKETWSRVVYGAMQRAGQLGVEKQTRYRVVYNASHRAG
jgi:hypothetical protein